MSWWLALLLALGGGLGAGLSGGGGGGGGSSYSPSAIHSYSSGSSGASHNTDYSDAPTDDGYGIAYHSDQAMDWLGESYTEESAYSYSGWVDVDDGVSWNPSVFMPGEEATVTFTASAFLPVLDNVLTSAPVSVSWNQYVRIWIDWDQNGSFDNDEALVWDGDQDYWHRYLEDVQPGELLQATIDWTFLVPEDALAGDTWLRARIGRGIMGPSSGIGYGEVEDYLITVGEQEPIVPEPATLLLFGSALLGSAGFLRKYRVK